MIIKTDGSIIDTQGYMDIEQNGIHYYVKGTFFMPGFKAGLESIKQFAKIYEDTNCIDFINCMGSFHFVIEKNNEIIIFTDNGLSRCWFYNDECMSDNMISLLKITKEIQLDKKNIAQYIVYNKVFFHETYVKNVKLSDSNEFYTVKDNVILPCKKDIGTLDSKNFALSADEFSSILKYSLQDLNKVISLTGGFDSRYVLSLLYGSKKLAASISGTDENHSDFTISKKVAEIADIPYKQEIVPKPDIDDEYLVGIFLSRGGYFNIFNDGTFRLNTYLSRKKQEGYECLMTGDTGCFHKSEGWYQYLPFYRCKHYSIERFYKNIVVGNKRSFPFSVEMQKLADENKTQILEYFNDNRKLMNTQNYDWQAWYVNKASSYQPLYTNQSRLLESYPPLMEYRFVINSYNLPRRKRALATYMKEYITKINPDVAKIPTVNNITASSEKKFILRDMWFSVTNLFKAACRLFGRMIFKKNFFIGEPVIEWSCEKEIRGMKLSQNALDFAYDENFFDRKWTTETIPYDILCKLLEIYLLKEYCKDCFKE